jgi:hypothetical protein
MAKHTIIAAEDANKKINGFYIFDWVIYPNDKDEPKENDFEIKNDPNLTLVPAGGTERITPRDVTAIDDKICILSRKRIGEIEKVEDQWQLVNDRSLSEIGASEKVVDKTNLCGGYSQIRRGKSVTSLLNIYLSDKIKTNPTEGQFFVSRDGDLKNFSLVEDLQPTGKIYVGDNHICVPGTVDAPNMARIYHKVDFIRRQYDQALSILMPDNILSISTKDDQILVTDRSGNYTLRQGTQVTEAHMPADYEPFFDNSDRLILPMEATSSALIEHEGNSLALFGIDEGKILLYSVTENGPEYLKTVNFLSLDSTIREADKDNHIWGLEYQNEMVSFNLRNMFIHMPVSSLMKYENADRNTSPLHTKEQLSTYQEQYGIEKLFQVPHRIISWTTGGRT